MDSDSPVIFPVSTDSDTSRPSPLTFTNCDYAKVVAESISTVFGLSVNDNFRSQCRQTLAVRSDEEIEGTIFIQLVTLLDSDDTPSGMTTPSSSSETTLMDCERSDNEQGNDSNDSSMFFETLFYDSSQYFNLHDFVTSNIPEDTQEDIQMVEEILDLMAEMTEGNCPVSMLENSEDELDSEYILNYHSQQANFHDELEML